MPNLIAQDQELAQLKAERLKLQQEARAFMCDVCGDTFTSAGALGRHQGPRTCEENLEDQCKEEGLRKLQKENRQLRQENRALKQEVARLKAAQVAERDKHRELP